MSAHMATLQDALENRSKLTDAELEDAFRGCDLAARGNAHDKKAAARWRRAADRFFAEQKRRRA